MDSPKPAESPQPPTLAAKFLTYQVEVVPLDQSEIQKVLTAMSIQHWRLVHANPQMMNAGSPMDPMGARTRPGLLMIFEREEFLPVIPAIPPPS